MIVSGWYELQRAIDKAVPCYTPVESPPYGSPERCGACQGCEDHGDVIEAMRLVELAIEKALAEAEAA